MTGRKPLPRRRLPGLLALLHRRRDLTGVSPYADRIQEAVLWNV